MRLLLAETQLSQIISRQNSYFLEFKFLKHVWDSLCINMCSLISIEAEDLNIEEGYPF